MSLRKLLNWHYFSVQTIKHAGRDSAGAIDRKNQWITTRQNLKGHLQAQMSSTSKGRDDVILDYGKPELELSHVLWHNYTDLTLTPDERIIINPNAELTIDFTTTLTKESVMILNIVSPREPVVRRRLSNRTIFEVYLKQATRFDL